MCVCGFKEVEEKGRGSRVKTSVLCMGKIGHGTVHYSIDFVAENLD